MIYDIVSFSVILLCLIGIIVIVVRRFPQIANIDIDTIQEEKDSAVKKELVRKRLERVLTEKKENLKRVATPLGKKVSGGVFGVYKKLQKTYEDLEAEEKISAGDDSRSDTEKNIDKAWRYFNTENLEEAENLFIKVLEEEPQNTSAYEGLANVYIETRENEKAKETLIYLLKLAGNLEDKSNDAEKARYHHLLGNVFEKEEDYVLAKEHYLSAHQKEPNNPKYLDILVKISIIQKDVSTAREYLLKLKEVNPDNKKIEELQEKIYKL